VFSAGTQIRIDFTYKHCRVKLYLKEGRALRIETVINDADDLDILQRLLIERAMGWAPIEEAATVVTTENAHAFPQRTS
jgi:hypothetical protein